MLDDPGNGGGRGRVHWTRKGAGIGSSTSSRRTSWQAQGRHRSPQRKLGLSRICGTTRNGAQVLLDLRLFVDPRADEQSDEAGWPRRLRARDRERLPIVPAPSDENRALFSTSSETSSATSSLTDRAHRAPSGGAPLRTRPAGVAIIVSRFTSISLRSSSTGDARSAAPRGIGRRT